MTPGLTPSPASPAERPAKPSRGPGSFPLRDRPTIVWLALALLAIVLHPLGGDTSWLAIHLLLLGALSHAIIVWSTHFAQALLKTPERVDPRRAQEARILTLAAGAALVIVGVSVPVSWLTDLGALLVAGAVGWHAIALARRLRISLPGRFRITLTYYFAAAGALVVGATFGAILARHPGGELHARIFLAHTLVMLLGWVGLTVLGTLLTLWPTMLRTRMDERAEKLTRQALPIAGVALLGIALAALWGPKRLVAGFIALYLLAVLWWGRALWRPARVAPPRHFATWSVTAALLWFVLLLVVLVPGVGSSESWAALIGDYDSIALIAAVGFAAQLLLGALAYLVPVVLGGGAGAWRAAQTWFDRATVTRVVLTNGGLILWLLALPAGAHLVALILTIGALAAFLPLLLLAYRAAVAARTTRPAGPGAVKEPLPPERGVWSGAEALGTLAVLGTVALSALVL